VTVLNFGARSHFSFIDCMFYNASMFVEHCKENNNYTNVLLMVCAVDHYYMKIVDKFQSKIQISDVHKSNSNFKTEVQKYELRLTSQRRHKEFEESLANHQQ